MGKIVGIDLGTTNSVIAVMEGGEPLVIPLAEGSRMCPSVAGFSRAGERLVGQLAKRQAITCPDRTVTSIKREMGSDHRVTIEDRSYSPQEISAMILQKLKADAEAFLGAPVEQAVITVPAYFNDAQRQATKDAGRIAGLEVLRILNEPTAAALAYGMDQAQSHRVLVWDLGGGTFDVSILDLDDGVFEVKATNGVVRLGGDDWDDRIVEWLIREFIEETGIDLRGDLGALQRLKEAAEKAKIELSNLVTTTISLPFIATAADGPLHLERTLTRARFEDLTDDLREKMIAPTRRALRDASLEPGDIDRVLLVGGSTRMPAVQDMVRKMFGKAPHHGIDPDEVVACGAAIQAGVLGGDIRDIVLLDVIPMSLGIETVGGVMTRLIPRNTTIPTSRTETFTTSVDGQTAVDIHILQGESASTAGNKTLGRFLLTGIPAAPQGVPRIAVTFEIDANGIVGVRARNTTSGEERYLVVTASTGLSSEEIDQMVRDGASHAREDRLRRETQAIRNSADALLLSGEKALRDAGGTVDPVLIARAREAQAALHVACDSEDGAVIQREIDHLAEVLYHVSREMIERGAITPDRTQAFGVTAATPTLPDDLKSQEVGFRKDR